MQWLPLPLFAIYRVLLFVYVLIWLILHIVTRADVFGPRWLIFITDLSYALLFFATGSMAILCIVYTMLHYTSGQKLLKYIPKRDFPMVRVYKQDNIPWPVKVVWLLYIIATTSAVLVFIGYWSFVYRPCSGGSSGSMSMASGSGSMPMGNGSVSMPMGNGSVSSSSSCAIDIHTIQLHGINVVLVLIDLAVSRMPYQFLHILYPSLFTLLYVIFSLIYWGAGGTNHRGDTFIYSALDYGSRSTAFGLAIILIIAPAALYVILFLLAWLRDVVYIHIGCCFRDVKELAYRDSEGGGSREVNGVAEEVTKV